MKTLCRAALAALSCLSTLEPPAAHAARGAAPVAVVFELAGDADLTLPDAAPRPLRLRDWLPAGTALAVRPGSRLALAFANGHRYELGEGARATLGRAGLATRSGRVRALPAVPPLPGLAAIAAEERPAPRHGAVRIRSERIAGLYPHAGAAAPAGSATLRFTPVSGGGTYRVEVRDRRGELVFGVETAASEVTVPAGVLRPGRRYAWSVCTVERAGPLAQGSAELVTLPAADAGAREALRQALAEEGGRAAWVLLAAVDESLGLLAEARDGLRAALQAAPGDRRLAADLAELEKELPYLQSP